MKEYIFWYPLFSVIPWAFNYVLARTGLVQTLIPLRLWVVGAFSIAWIQYSARIPSGMYWPIHLLFMFGIPYGVFMFVMSFSDIVSYDHNNSKEGNVTTEQNQSESANSENGTE